MWQLMRAAIGAVLAAVLAVAGPSAAGSRAARPVRIVFGASVRGRPLLAWRLGSPTARRVVLVVGCIHGDECAGLRITAALRRAPVPAGVALWLVPELNPDGTAAGTRQNAHGVDLNRNFPWRWQHIAHPVYASGPRPGSEPEARAMMALVRRLRPAVTVTYHQHMDLVVETAGGDHGIAREYARVAGLRPTCLTFLSGVETGWSNALLPRTTAFVVELPAGPVGVAALRRHLAAVRGLELGRRVGSPTRCDGLTPAA